MDEALRAYQTANNLDLEFAEVYLKLGEAYHHSQQPIKARAAYSEYFAVQSNRTNKGLNALAYRNRGKLYLAEGDIDKAIEDFQNALKEDPNNEKVSHLGLGICFLILDKDKEAHQHFQRAPGLNEILTEFLITFIKNKIFHIRQVDPKTRALKEFDYSELIKDLPPLAKKYALRYGLFRHWKEIPDHWKLLDAFENELIYEELRHAINSGTFNMPLGQFDLLLTGSNLPKDQASTLLELYSHKLSSEHEETDDVTEEPTEPDPVIARSPKGDEAISEIASLAPLARNDTQLAESAEPAEPEAVTAESSEPAEPEETIAEPSEPEEPDAVTDEPDEEAEPTPPPTKPQRRRRALNAHMDERRLKQEAPPAAAKPAQVIIGEEEGCAIGKDCYDPESHQRVNDLIKRAINENAFFPFTLELEIDPNDMRAKQLESFFSEVLMYHFNYTNYGAMSTIISAHYFFFKPRGMRTSQIPTLLWAQKEGENQRYQVAHAGTGGTKEDGTARLIPQVFISYGLIHRLMKAKDIKTAAMLLHHEAKHALERVESKRRAGTAETVEDLRESEILLERLMPYIEEDILNGRGIEETLKTSPLDESLRDLASIEASL